MGESDTLTALGVSGEWIWGNDLETIVFAQAFGYGKTLIFRFTLGSKQQSQSLTTRIVNCYHDLTVDSTSATFPNRPSMRTAIWSAIAAVWAKCSEQPAVKDPDVIIDVYDTESAELPSRITRSICHDDIFNDFLDLLLPSSQLLVKQPMNTVDFTTLTRLEQLGGRGCSTLVHTLSDPKSPFVFKGIDFRTFLYLYESGHIQEEVKIYYRSVELVSNMPPHPNIMPPAHSLVTICKPGDDRPVVCGTLHAFLPNGNLSSHIEKNNDCGKPVPPSRKALWCYQMAAAIAHTHFVARIYHMDIKPGNFLLDADLHLVSLIGSKAMPPSPQQPQRLMALGTWKKYQQKIKLLPFGIRNTRDRSGVTCPRPHQATVAGTYGTFFQYGTNHVQRLWS